MHPFLKYFLIWSVVCWLAAGPSFFIGGMLAEGRPEQMAAMAVGVFLFVFAYAAVSCHPAVERLRKRPFVERTMKIGYGIRIGQSMLSIVPGVVAPDMVCGIASVLFVMAISGVADSDPFMNSLPFAFPHFLATTIVQGVLLNIILFVLMGVIYGLQRLFMKAPASSDPTKFCAGCGYDLRASPEACPECGMGVPAKQVAAGV